MRTRLGGLEGRRVAIALAKIAVASVVMGIAAHFTAAWLTSMTPGGGEVAKFVRVFGAIGAALAVLAGTARLLRVDEFNDAAGRVLQRFKR